MTLDVVEVSTKNGIHAFNSFPKRIYRDFYRAPAFTTFKNKTKAEPLFSRVDAQPFIAVKDGHPVGRVAASVHNAITGGKTGFFGYFESYDDIYIAGALLEKAYHWIAARGFNQMIGPVDLTPHERLGLLVKGFEGYHFPGMPYNPPYYPVLLEEYGLKTETDLYAYHLDFTGFIPERLARVANRAERMEGLRVRQVDFGNTAAEGKILALLHNESMKEIWGFVPLLPEEAASILNKFKRVYDPEMVLVAEVRGMPVGFCLALLPLRVPSIFEKSSRVARLAVFAVLPDFRLKGIEAMLILEFIKRAGRKGISIMEFSQVAENNIMMNRIIRSYHKVKKSRHYRIYKV